MNRFLSALAGMAAMTGTGAAQPAPVMFAPASQDKILINARSIDVRDGEGVAEFRDAKYSQGDVRLQCSRLIVRYRAVSSSSPPAVQHVECHPR
jgi:hypothetical protein